LFVSPIFKSGVFFAGGANGGVVAGVTGPGSFAASLTSAGLGSCASSAAPAPSCKV